MSLTSYPTESINVQTGNPVNIQIPVTIKGYSPFTSLYDNLSRVIVTLNNNEIGRTDDAFVLSGATVDRVINISSNYIPSVFAQSGQYTFVLNNQVRFEGSWVNDGYYNVTIITTSTSSEITITYPSSGATLTRGNTYNVTWTGTDSGSVKIQLYKDNVLSDTLMTSTLNDGTWSWVMSTTSTNVGSGYTLKITHLTSGTTGTSSVFNIAPASTITKYKCINNVCTSDPTGTFTDNTCGGTCVTQPPVTCIPAIDEINIGQYISGVNMCVKKIYVYAGVGVVALLILK